MKKIFFFVFLLISSFSFVAHATHGSRRGFKRKQRKSKRQNQKFKRQEAKLRRKETRYMEDNPNIAFCTGVDISQIQVWNYIEASKYIHTLCVWEPHSTAESSFIYDGYKALKDKRICDAYNKWLSTLVGLNH